MSVSGRHPGLLTVNRVPVGKLGLLLGVPVLFVLVGALSAQMPAVVIGLCILVPFSLLALANPRDGLIIAIIALPITQGWIGVVVAGFTITFSYLFTAILVCAWMTSRALSREKSKLVRLPLYPPMIAFLVANVISVVLSPAPVIGIKHIVKIVYYLLLFVLIANLIVSDKDLIRLIRAWLFSAVVFSLVALVIYFSPSAPPSSWTIELSSNPSSPTVVELKTQKSMPFGNSEVNRLALGFGTGWVESAIFPMIGILLTVSALLQRGDPMRHKGLYLVAALLLTVALLLTYSRGGWLATLAGLGVLLALERRNPRLLLIAVLLLAIVMVVPSSIADRFRQIFGEEASRRGRIMLWQETWNYILQNPVFGIGPGMTLLYLAPFAYAMGWASLDSIVQSHNVFLTFWAETGTVGFVMLLWLQFASIRPALAAWQVVSGAQQTLILRALLANVAAAIVFGIFTNRLADWFWVLLALLAVASRLSLPEGVSREASEQVQSVGRNSESRESCRR